MRRERRDHQHAVSWLGRPDQSSQGGDQRDEAEQRGENDDPRNRVRVSAVVQQVAEGRGSDRRVEEIRVRQVRRENSGDVEQRALCLRRSLGKRYLGERRPDQ